MSETDPVDTVAPWTIKAVPTATRDAVTRAARREGLTVGQWLERRVNEWEGAGSPVTVSSQASISLGDLAHAMEAARALASDAKVEVPPQLAKDGLSLVRLAIRHAKGGLPRPTPKPQPAGLAAAARRSLAAPTVPAAEEDAKMPFRTPPRATGEWTVPLIPPSPKGRPP